MQLETKRLLIRKVSLDDAKAMEPILGDAEVMRYSLKGALDHDGIVAYLQNILDQYEKKGVGLCTLVHKPSGRVCGLAGLGKTDVDEEEYVEVGYRLAQEFWGQGLASEAVKAIRNYAFDELGLTHLISIIEPSNVASIKVASRLGMHKEWSTTYHGFNVDIYGMEKIFVEDYDPSWKKIYKRERELLENVFGNFSIRFEHIGSTSIPDCSAKSVIDICGITPDILNVDAFNEALEKEGFIPLGEFGMKQRRLFRKRHGGSVNLHVFEDSDPEIARHLRFRDYLILHPDKRDEYGEIKKKNSRENQADIQEYILGKAAFIKEIDRLAALDDHGDSWPSPMGHRRSKWSFKEIKGAMEVNMQLHMTYFSKYLPMQELIYEPDVTVVVSTIPDDTFNYVLAAEFEKKHAPDRIQHVLEIYRKRKIPFSWWTSESNQPDSLHEDLKSCGLRFKEEDVGMFLDLEETVINATTGSLEIQRILSSEELKDFTDIFAKIGGYEKAYEDFYRHIPPVLYGERAPLEIYVGYRDGKPIVTGIALFHANVMGIYFVMTDPEHRRKGYGSEMMVALIHRAKAKGYHMITLQASAEGLGLYQKLGFQSLCRFVEFR